MTELRIDAEKAERLMTRTLRDEGGMLPADAIAVAANICRQLTAAMPTSAPLAGYRIISREPPYGSDFAVAVAKKFTEPKSEPWMASELWQLVYDQGCDLRAA
jgi:hypothetical protein